MSPLTYLRKTPRLAVASVAAMALAAAMIPGTTAVGANGQAASTQSFAATSTDQAASKQGDLTTRVRGTFGKSGTVRGTFDPERFINRGDQVYAVGTLNGVLRRGDGSLVGRTSKTVTIPVKGGRATSASSSQSAAPECQILDLVLGPLDLNLLGLKVHLDKVVLHITAAPGEGALLGNLLCAVAGLLDGTRLIDRLRLANILDRILTVLGL